MNTISKSRELTQRRADPERFAERNRAKAKARKRGPQHHCGTPEDRATHDLFMGRAATFLAGHGKIKPPTPPFGLVQIVAQFDHHTLAAAILVPVLHEIKRGWNEDKSEQMRACRRLGECLRDQIEFKGLPKAAATEVRRGRKPLWNFAKAEWGIDECVHAGNWMLECAEKLDYFVIDDRGFLAIAPTWQTYIDEVKEELLWRQPLFAPHLTPPPPWTGWRIKYDDRLQAEFIRGDNPEARPAIEAAFAATGKPQTDEIDGEIIEIGVTRFEHADGVNTLKRVAYKLDQSMVDLVERLGPEVMKRKRGIRKAQWADDDRRTIANDIDIARWIGSQSFYTDYNCDFRGRLYALSHFHYGREDHVRALFRFANGKRIDGLEWLEIHAANCGGGKGTWAQRLAWTKENQQKIKDIAASPDSTLDLWWKHGFCYVAACKELVAAWANPDDHITHMPIPLDATCSGVQHLAMLARDEKAGVLVNLTKSDKRHDLYLDIATRVYTAVTIDGDRRAKFWIECFEALNDAQRRGLVKTTVMTFGYGATLHGMAAKITEEYADLFSGLEPRLREAHYLARKIMEACREVLPGPQGIMDYICAIASYLADQDKFLQWRTPTGFPVFDDYRTPKRRVINVKRHGVPIQHTVADGYEPHINKKDAENAAAPNFVHSLDSSFLVRGISAAAAEGIDVVPVHDSFAALAPDVAPFGRIARREMQLLYANQDHLADLGRPPRGTLDPLDCGESEYLIS
jgi:hypothetical protein